MITPFNVDYSDDGQEWAASNRLQVRIYLH